MAMQRVRWTPGYLLAVALLACPILARAQTTDLFFQNSSTGNLALWTMDGVNLVSSSLISPANPGAGWQLKTIMDVDGDGLPDLILQNSSTGNIAFWLLDGATLKKTTGLMTPSSFGSGWRVVDIGAVGPGGQPEMLLQNTNTGVMAYWLMDGGTQTGTGLLTPTVPAAGLQPVGILTNSGPDSATGAIDWQLLMQNPTNGSLTYWNMSGSSLLSTGTWSPSGPGPGWRYVGIDYNIDGNGTFAMIFQNNTNFNLEYLALPTTQGSNTLTQGNLPAPGAGWLATGVVSLNGGQNNGILFQNTSTGNLVYWQLTNNTVQSSGSFSPSNPGPNWKVVGVGDLDLDGFADIVFENSSNGQLAFWLTTGTSIKSASGLITPANPGSGWVVQGVGRFLSSSTRDLVLQNSGTSEVAYWPLDVFDTVTNNGVFNPSTPGTDWRALGGANWTGTGNSTDDLMFQSANTGDLALWYLTGATRNSAALVSPPSPGTQWRAAAIAYVNYLPDLLFQNTSTGDLAYWLLYPYTTTQLSEVASGLLSPSNPGPGWVLIAAY